MWYRSLTWTARWMTFEVNCKYLLYTKIFHLVYFNVTSLYDIWKLFIVFISFHYYNFFIFFISSSLAWSQLWRRFRNTRTNSPNFKRKRPNSTSVINWNKSRRRSSLSRRRTKRYDRSLSIKFIYLTNRYKRERIYISFLLFIWPTKRKDNHFSSSFSQHFFFLSLFFFFFLRASRKRNVSEAIEKKNK